MSYRRSLIFIALLGVFLSSTAQYTKEFKRIFFDAEYLYQTGFYDDAFNRYKNLLGLDPGNSNILFHCGACCLSIPGNEQEAVNYLKEAVSGVSLDYKDNSHKESAAPVLTYYMLGRAYHLINSFEKAIEYYTLYLETAPGGSDQLQLEYAALQIDACNRAKLVVKDAPSFEFQSVLDHFEDDLPSCNNPVISGDGNILIFLVDYPNDKKIMMTRRRDSVWSRPEVINSEIGMVGETYPVSLSYDGLELYLVHRFYSHSDVFVSRYENDRWSEAEALGPHVNGRTSEDHASISKDGLSLYYTSDARGGEGSFDIYVSRLDEKGEWGQSSNLGTVINTPYEEHSPFISSNDSILFFSSQGHKSIGGVDVFYSELGENGSWNEPVNLGYPVNTTADNIFFNPGWDELDGYYAVRRADDPTSNTINMVLELDPPEEIPEEIPEELAEELEEEVIEEILLAPVLVEPENTEEILEVLNSGNREEAPPAPAPAPAPEPEEIIIYQQAGSRILQTTVPFEYNEFELGLAGMLEVEKVAAAMQTYPQSSIHLSGHADATGSPAYNMLLSNQRAVKIAEYLDMRGIDRSRITMEGKGESAPVARNQYQDGSDAPLGRYLNRQVIVTLENPEPLQAELSGFFVPEPLKVADGDQDNELSEFWFTVQIEAAIIPISISQYEGVESIKEYICKDSYYRYASGEFRSFEEAQAYLEKMKASGYDDAFIQTLEWYRKAIK